MEALLERSHMNEKRERELRSNFTFYARPFLHCLIARKVKSWTSAILETHFI